MQQCTLEADAESSKWPDLKGQDLVDLLIGERLRDAAGRVLPVPDVALAGPVIGYVFVPKLEGHLPNK